MPEHFSNLTDKLASWATSFQDKKKRRVELSSDEESSLEKDFYYFFQELITNLQTVSDLLDIPNKESDEFIFGTYRFVGIFNSQRDRILIGKDLAKVHNTKNEAPLYLLIPHDKLYPKYVLELLNNSAVVPKRIKILTRYLKDLQGLRDELERSDLLGPEVSKNLVIKP